MTPSDLSAEPTARPLEHIHQMLPQMRRFARALTGDSDEGDNLVERALMQLAGEPGAVSGDLRISAYRSVIDCYRDVARIDASTGPDSKIQQFPVRPREVFLLLNVEGLSRAETAAVLGAPLAEVDRLIAEANEVMARDARTDVLIIEDEPLIAMDLEALAGELGHTVIAIARTRSEAAAAVARHPPGLILADIELADGSSGVDAVNEIARRCQVPAIFVTAYPERALAGLVVEPAFLLTKPFRPETLKTLIRQALYFQQNAVPAN